MQHTLKHVTDDRELEGVAHHGYLRQILLNVLAQDGPHFLITLQVPKLTNLILGHEFFAAMRAPDGVKSAAVKRLLRLVEGIFGHARVLKHLILAHVVNELLCALATPGSILDGTLRHVEGLHTEL